MDILEFGRVIHAEMSAISDAARLGRATKDATLFCTTFPCHICAMEPTPAEPYCNLAAFALA
jgi:deoxycytidylate deaminase